MTNEQKYKTAEERNYAYAKYCGSRLCKECALHDKRDKELTCAFNWLALETEKEKEKLEPCPFCGGECRTVKNKYKSHVVWCDNCCYCSRNFDSDADAIAAHNRVARAVRAAKESEAKHEEA